MSTKYGHIALKAESFKGRTLDGDNAKGRTFAVGGTASTGDYTMTLSYKGVEVGTATFPRTSEDNAGIAAGVRAAWDAVPALAAVSAAAGGTSTAVAITLDSTGEDYLLETTAPGTGTFDMTAASHTLKEGLDRVLLVDTATIPITVVLPPAANCHDGKHGQLMTFIGLGDSDLVLDGNGSEEIDGSTTATTSDANLGRTVWCSGTAWYTVP